MARPFLDPLTHFYSKLALLHINELKAQIKNSPLFWEKTAYPGRKASFTINKYVEEYVHRSYGKVFLFEETVITNMPTTVWNRISGKQSSSPRFSLVRPPAPELLSSHHAVDYYSSWQHLISSCQLLHGNLISGSQLGPGELLCGNINSSVKLPGLLSGHVSSSRQLSLSLLSQ